MLQKFAIQKTAEATGDLKYHGMSKNLLDNKHYISYLNSEKKLGLKQMINQEECTIPIVT